MGLFDFLNNVPQSQNDQSNQPPPAPWNTRTPMPTSSPSPSGDWNARTPFTQTQDNSQQQSDPSNVSAPPSTPASGGGFFSNLLNGVKNIAGVVGGKFDQFEHATGLDHIAGAMKGIADPTITPFQSSNDSSYGGLWKNILNAGVHDIGDYGKSIAQGFLHPDQAKQHMQDTISNSNLDPVSKMILNLMGTSASDPLSYVPVGGMAKILGNGIKTASDATKLTPIFNAASSTLRNAPVIKPTIDSTKDILGTLFKKGYGTSADTMPTMDGLQGTLSADQYAIQQKMAELAQSHNLNSSQLEDLAHHIDGRPTMDPHVQQSAQQLKDILSGGFNSAHGRVNGTDAELRNGFTGSAPSLQDLFSGKSGNPIRSGAVENYYPRRFNNTPDEVKSALEQYNQTAKGLSTNGVFNQKRSFDTLQEAIDHGLKPEMNPYVAIGQRMAETSKAVNTDNAIKQLLYSGVVKKNVPSEGLAESTLKPFNSHITEVPGKNGETVPLLQKYFMKPHDQSAIMRAINPQGAKTAAESTLDKIAKPYDALTNEYKKFALYNPLVHGHNIGYNGMYLGGADPSHVAETMGNLVKGTTDPWYQRALSAGAVSSDTKGGGAFSDALRNSVAPQEKSLLQNIGSKINYARHGALWDADKAMRTSIFRQAVEGGASDTEAAAKANKFMVNYNNNTPFESSVMKRIFPFYSWMKGNIPMQAEQMINNTPKQLFANNAINAASRALSGNDSKDGKMDFGQTLSDGSHVMVDPYIPSADPGKLLKDGPIPFLFNRTNPILKEGADQAANKAYSPIPLTTANGKDYLNKTEIRPAGADQGYDTRSSIAHALKTMNPFSGGAVGGNVDTTSMINSLFGLKNKDTPDKSSTERTVPILGGFTSRDNPTKSAFSQALQDRQNLQDHNAFNKSQGIPVSKAEKKAAYRKIR